MNKKEIKKEKRTVTIISISVIVLILGALYCTYIILK